MADLTDPRVVHELEVQVKAAGVDMDRPRSYAEMTKAQYEYHVQLLALMEEALGDNPTAEQQAVYDAQQARVDEARRFMESAGIGTRSTTVKRQWAGLSQRALAPESMALRRLAALFTRLIVL